jgi:hypothetical protein
MDIYHKPLNSNDYILLYLKQFINEISLCKKIINIKKISENKEILNYHFDRWENIAGEHFYTKNNHYNKFSYILDSEKYIIKPDHRLNFFYMTGISYQIIELIFELIHINNEKNWDFKFMRIEDKKDWLNHDDKLYSILSKKIMIEMNKYKIK